MIGDLGNVVSVVQKRMYCSDVTASCDLWHELLCLVNGKQRNAYKLLSIHLPLCLARYLGDYCILQDDLKQPHPRHPSTDFAFIEVSLCVAKTVSKAEKYEMC